MAARWQHDGSTMARCSSRHVSLVVVCTVRLSVYQCPSECVLLLNLNLSIPQAPPAYPMPPANHLAWPAAELGMKLACGFEMLCAAQTPASEAGSAAAEPAAEAAAEPDSGGRSWAAFQVALQQAGRGELGAESGAEGAAAAEPAAAQKRFAAIAGYVRAADVQARPTARIDQLLQVRFSSRPAAVSHISAGQCCSTIQVRFQAVAASNHNPQPCWDAHCVCMPSALHLQRHGACLCVRWRASPNVKCNMVGVCILHKCGLWPYHCRSRWRRSSLAALLQRTATPGWRTPAPSWRRN